jgi:hypothetical protein
MVKARNVDERVMRFHALYASVVQQDFDRSEFDTDDLYAFMAFERALRSDNQELRNIAAHLQAQRQSSIETITISSNEPMMRTRKMPTMAADQPAPKGVAQADAVAVEERPERRSGDARLTRSQVALVSDFQRLYTKAFGTALDISQFIFDDDYGRAVLYQSLGAENASLVSAAKNFLDESGRPRLHRRGTEETRAGDEPR